MGAPSHNFNFLPEYAYSAAILRIDLAAIGTTTYDLPDARRRGSSGPRRAVRRQRRQAPGEDHAGSPVQVYAPGFRNPFALVRTQRRASCITVDNGPNAGWGGVPIGKGPVGHVHERRSANVGLHDDDSIHLLQRRLLRRPSEPDPCEPREHVQHDESAVAGRRSNHAIECDYRDPTNNGSLATLPSGTTGMARVHGFEPREPARRRSAGRQRRRHRLPRDARRDRHEGARDRAVVLEPWWLRDRRRRAGRHRTAPGHDLGPEPAAERHRRVRAERLRRPPDAAVLRCEQRLASTRTTTDTRTPTRSRTVPIRARAPTCRTTGITTSSRTSATPTTTTTASPTRPTRSRSTRAMGSRPTSRSRTRSRAATPGSPCAPTPVPSGCPGGIIGLGFTGLMSNGVRQLRGISSTQSRMTVGGAAGVLTVDQVPPGDALDADEHAAVRVPVRRARTGRQRSPCTPKSSHRSPAPRPRAVSRWASSSGPATRTTT